jgi:hypothetical protein
MADFLCLPFCKGTWFRNQDDSLCHTEPRDDCFVDMLTCICLTEKSVEWRRIKAALDMSFGDISLTSPSELKFALLGIARTGIPQPCRLRSGFGCSRVSNPGEF